MATREETHSTRGRAHMLFEALSGELLKGGMADESVREALDLCLSCKGCKRECPAGVDLAAYKAEFLAHYYQASGARCATACSAGFTISRASARRRRVSSTRSPPVRRRQEFSSGYSGSIANARYRV